MSPEAEAKLFELVKNAPAYRTVYRSGAYCALERAMQATSNRYSHYVDLMKDLGFLPGVAYGIMDGWDYADGADKLSCVITRKDDEKSYDYGFDLGQKLFRAVYP